MSAFSYRGYSYKILKARKRKHYRRNWKRVFYIIKKGDWHWWNLRVVHVSTDDEKEGRESAEEFAIRVHKYAKQWIDKLGEDEDEFKRIKIFCQDPNAEFLQKLMDED